jgi:hypothetical protein
MLALCWCGDVQAGVLGAAVILRFPTTAPRVTVALVEER